jgi:DNA-binding LacI/PurR family transcriptional regulator
MPSTMADVAERAGVSKSTVSLVLNNKPTVSLELRRAVLKAASELGYHLPTRRAARRSAASKSIVAIHYERHRPDPLATSILLNYVAGIQSFVRDKDVHLTFVTEERRERDQFGYQLLDGAHLSADGAILMGWSARRDGEVLRMLIDRGLPLVVLSRDWPDLPISTVGQDHHQQARIALDHLVGLGHRQIALLAAEADRQHEWFEWRRECYEAKMRELHGQVDQDLVVVAEDCVEATQALAMRRKDVTAIFAITDPNAVAAIRGLRGIGLDVPRDMSVVGLDGAVADVEDCPELTTVAWPHFQAGYLAGELLVKQIENKHLYFSKVVVRSELVKGATCGPPASRLPGCGL